MGTPHGSSILTAVIWQSRDVWLFLSVIFLFILAFSRYAFPKVFAATYSPLKFFTLRSKEDFGTGLRILSIEYLHFTFVLSAATVFILLVFNDYLDDKAFLPAWLNPSDLGEGLLIWMGMSAVFVLLFMLRYLMISGFGQLFNLPNGISRHFQEAQSLNQVFVLFIWLVVTVTLYSQFYFPEFIFNTILITALSYLVYRQLNLYIKFLGTGGYSKLFIFSYLCTTEIIPALIAIKLLL